MRIRSVKPEIVEDEALGACSLGAQLLYRNLITSAADDHGRFRAAPIMLAGRLFPYRDDVDATVLVEWLTELQTARVVVLYEVRAEAFGVLPSWGAHQRIDNAGKPLYPAPPEDEDQQQFMFGGSPILAEVRGGSPRTAASEIAESRGESPKVAARATPSPSPTSTPTLVVPLSARGPAPARADFLPKDDEVDYAKPYREAYIASHGGNAPPNGVVADFLTRARQLEFEGQPSADILAALRLCAEKNKHPNLLPNLLGDVQAAPKPQVDTTAPNFKPVSYPKAEVSTQPPQSYLDAVKAVSAAMKPPEPTDTPPNGVKPVQGGPVPATVAS